MLARVKNMPSNSTFMFKNLLMNNNQNLKEIRDELASIELKILKLLKPHFLISIRGYSHSDYLQHCIDISKNIQYQLERSKDKQDVEL